MTDIRKFAGFPFLKARFMKKLPLDCFTELNTSKCWNWQGSVSYGGSGYGNISWSGTNYYAHRISYIIFNGIIPHDKIVRHTCDNHLCMNPKHLILGTHYDNSIDSVKRNRQHKQKLNEECVKVIKWMMKYKSSCHLAAKLARLHNVSKSTIYKISTGYSWGWVKI